ncbi:lipoyl(octanoyl) transferase LipB [Leucobacter zeae]|nr:lipoyl(octanoyl) transferase LipB [Leucobacter zeae]
MSSAPAIDASIRSTTVGLSPDLVPYGRGIRLQSDAVARLEAGIDRGSLLLLEHESVYTAGRRSDPADYPKDGSPVVAVDRGGKVTWHGPGQLVAYPVVRLRARFGVVDFVRELEQALIDTAAEFGVTGFRVEGRSGVWVDSGDRSPSKVAQVGIHTRDGIVTHGVALNCSNAPEPFGNIVPCGISDAGVTTLSAVAGRSVSPADAAPALERHLLAMLEEVAA